MQEFNIELPKMGESVAEAMIVKWLKQPGEMIREDETLVEIATDKVDSEVPSPVSGKVLKYCFQENEVALVGDVIAVIETSAEGFIAAAERLESNAAANLQNESISLKQPVDEKKPIQDNELEQAADPVKLDEIPGIKNIPENNAVSSRPSNSSRFYSPLVKNIAAEEGLSSVELDSIPGTGAEGRLTKQDLLDYLNKNARKPSALSLPEPLVASQEERSFSQVSQIDQPDLTAGNNEIIEMDRMRRMISEHMSMSIKTSAHVTSFVESDVSNIVKWRDNNKSAFEKKVGEKITYTPIFIQAVAKALRDFPLINISLNGTQIIKKQDINIGIAAALPSGNLIVPVIKKADQLNLVGLTKAVNGLAYRSKNNKLQPDEVKDGTFTVTNIGSFGNIMGTPIINQPQVAILAIGAIVKKPAVIETEFGDMLGIRHKMFLSLSYDHRIVDGALGGMFLKKISDYLEAWDLNQGI